MNICDNCGDSLRDPTSSNLIIFKGTGGADRDDEKYSVCNECRNVIENILRASRESIEKELEGMKK